MVLMMTNGMMHAGSLASMQVEEKKGKKKMRQNAGICLNHNAHALHRPLVVSESMRHIRSITERSIIYAVSGYADRIMRSSRCGERSRDQDAIFGDPARIRSEEGF